MSFASASSVEPVDTDKYRAEVHPGWDIMGIADGGYLLAMAARACCDAAGRPDPISVTAHFMRPVTAGQVTIHTEVLREGRRFAVVRASMSTDMPALAVLGTVGSLEDSDHVDRIESGPPELPPPDECIPIEPTETFPPPFMGKVEIRLDPADSIFSTGRPSGRPRVRGWFRLRDDEPVDTLAAVLAADAFPPTIFDAGLPVAWTPTLELTVHVRARPRPGWLRCAFRTRFITGGFLEEDGEVWDEAGTLVAQSRQLALVPKG